MVGMRTIAKTFQRQTGSLAWVVFVIAAFVVIVVPARHLEASLREPALVTGYSLFAICGLLSLFNLRKRLSMFPTIAAAAWKRLHLAAGVLAVAVYWIHAETLWPTGAYEQVLALLFYLTALSGVVGFVCQQALPPRLTQTGTEIIFERIPDEIARLREQAEDTVLECTSKLESDTLARFYIETFQWFFRRPRFLVSHLWGGQQAAFWVGQQMETARRYLSEKELSYLESLRALAHEKTRLDFHYAAQGLLKLWLLVHVPVSVAMLLVALWHLLIVNIYSL